MNPVTSNIVKRFALTSLLIFLTSCTDPGGNVDTEVGSATSPGAFTLNSSPTLTLIEGNQAGVNIPINLTRIDGNTNPIELSIAGATAADERLISSSFSPNIIGADSSNSSLYFRLAIDDLPILPHKRTFYVTANDGINTAKIALQVNVEPVDAPDVYLLVGQSNMVGFSGDGTKMAQAGGLDEPHPRIFQLNVTGNESTNNFTTQADFTATESNVIGDAPIVQAEDPLHVPRNNDSEDGKNLAYIGMGMSFAKAALNNTSKNIVLVPAAWSGSAFCNNNDGPIGQWNAQPTSLPQLGNTWLFDRAVARTNIALVETGGILRGILWHQGESDANENCANLYLANLERLAQQLRLNINPDRRGGDLRRPDSNIPFVLGTMSRGIDERGDLSNFSGAKAIIDLAHKTLPSKIKHASVTINDDLVPANGYPCGNTTCIHFGPNALREMGSRYYQSLLRAVANP